MVGQWTVTKPGRRDEVLDANQQLQIANQIRAQFDSMVRKRHTKPSRSESITNPPGPSLTNLDQSEIPELDKLRSQSPDEQTGSGFIMVVKEEEEEEDGHGIQFSSGHGTGAVAGGGVVSCYRSNPAKNDWTPSFENGQGVCYLQAKSE